MQKAKSGLVAALALTLALLPTAVAGNIEVNFIDPQQYTDLRVMRVITWPRMQLEYDWLDGNGALRKQAQTRLADMDYLMPGHRIATRDEVYGYDKAMLGRWFEQKFCNRS